MTKNGRTTLLAVTIALAGLGATALPGVASNCDGCAPPLDPSYKVYVFENGSYRGDRDYGKSDGGSSRYVCFVYYGGSSCDFCGVCHTPKETADSNYVNKYDDIRHRSTHFAALKVPLAAGQKIALGSAQHLRLLNGEIAYAANAGKDIALFAGGSQIIMNRLRQPQLIALPAGTAPKILP